MSVTINTCDYSIFPLKTMLVKYKSYQLSFIITISNTLKTMLVKYKSMSGLLFFPIFIPLKTMLVKYKFRTSVS